MEPINENTAVGDVELQQDAWRAYKTFRGARFLFFLLTFFGLIAMEGAFWIVDRGLAGTPEQDQNQFWWTSGESNLSFASAPARQDSPPSDQSEQTYRKIVGQILDVTYYVIPFGAVLYCLSLLMGLNLALVGRLGGLVQSSKALFLSIIVLVLVVPWYEMINPAIPGALFGTAELAEKYSLFQENNAEMDNLGIAAYYGRFCGLWLVAFLLLFMAQVRSFQAAKRIRLRLIKGQTGNSASIVAAAAEVRKDNIVESLENDRF